MAFTFNPNPIISLDKPEPVYIVTQPTDFEVCNKAGLRLGSRLRLKERLSVLRCQISPQGTGSIWWIRQINASTDEYTIQPVGAKMQNSIVKISLVELKSNFIILNELNNRLPK